MSTDANKTSTDAEVEWDSIQNKATYDTIKFQDIPVGIYTCEPKRRINTKFGCQLIISMTSDCDTDVTFEAFVPNSYIVKLKQVCGDVERMHKLNLKASTNIRKNGREQYIYDFAIGRLKSNPVCNIERPIQEQSW